MPTSHKRPARPEGSPLQVILYTRVSTDEQTNSGLGLSAQETALRANALRRDWNIVCVLSDAGVSGKSLAGRPALAEALRLITAGEADALAVSKLDRLSRSLLDFAGLMARARKEGWALIANDVDVDTTTPSGRLIANVMASVAEWERDAIGARTRDALAVKKAQGVTLGRPRTVDADAVRRARELRAAGFSYARCAEQLNAERVPTAQDGRRWYASTVRKVLLSADRARDESRSQRVRPAAGVLMRRTDERGTWYLLGKRHPKLGGTWGDIGGSLRSGEDPLTGALREFEEEIGLEGPHPHEAVIAQVIQCGDAGVPYTLFVLDAPSWFDGADLSWENTEVCWWRADRIDSLSLHPGFARAWEGHVTTFGNAPEASLQWAGRQLRSGCISL